MIAWFASNLWVVLAPLAAAGAVLLVDLLISRRGPRELTDDELPRFNKWIRDAHTDVH